MTTAWPTTPLGELCDIRIGKTPPRAERRYWGPGHRWLSIADMNQGRRLRTTSETITDEAVSELRCRPVKPGTVLLSFKLSIGKVGIADVPMFTNEAIAHLPIRDVGAVDARYLATVLEWLDLAHGSDRAAMGSTLNKDKLNRVAIPLPPIEEQRRIAAVLDHAGAVRAKRSEAVTLLDSLTESIFLDMFGDPLSPSGSWPMSTLGALGNLDRGVSRHRPRNDPALLGGVHPLIQTGDVAASGGYITSYSSTYTDFGLQQSKLWPAGTLCITIAANIARTGILGFDACFPDSVVGFTGERPGLATFVQVLLGFHQQRLESLAPESAQKNINLKVLRELVVPSPPDELIAEFGRRCEEVRALEGVADQHSTALDELFASLQHRAFSGQL